MTTEEEFKKIQECLSAANAAQESMGEYVKEQLERLKIDIHFLVIVIIGQGLLLTVLMIRGIK